MTYLSIYVNRIEFESIFDPLDKTPALLDGSLQCGDEIVAINGINVKVLIFYLDFLIYNN